MEIRLELKQSLRQNLDIVQKIELTNLMAIPDEILSTITKIITDNPDKIESILQHKKQEKKKEFAPDSASKVKTIYSSWIPSKGGDAKGRIISPEIISLEDFFNENIINITPDVTYIGKKNNKPKIIFSDHLKGSIDLYLCQLDSSTHPETSQLIKNLLHYDNWKRDNLIKTYTILGERQREFFEEFDTSRFNKFVSEDLGEKLNLHHTTICRLLSNRWIEARNIKGEQRILKTKDLLISQTKLLRDRAIKYLNEKFLEEFEKGQAYSDKTLFKDLQGIVSRRAIAKYRINSGIPNSMVRMKEYASKSVATPYQIKED